MHVSLLEFYLSRLIIKVIIAFFSCIINNEEDAGDDLAFSGECAGYDHHGLIKDRS